MARRASAGFITFGILNIIVAIVPVCAGCGGLLFVRDNDGPLMIRGRDVGPQFRQHMEREVPHARYEAIGAALLNPCCCVLLLAGAVGLMMGHEWGRWVTLFAAVCFVFALCGHDLYQLAINRPAVNRFLDEQMPPGPERDGFKVGFGMVYFLWTCFNPLIMVYFFIMCICVLLFPSSHKVREPRALRSGRRRRYDDDDYDDY